MLEQKIIKVCELIPSRQEILEENDAVYSNLKDGVLMRLFGTIPDYTDDKMEALWQKVYDADEKDIFDFCLSEGVDVLKEDGTPVMPWRDIAVMLMARKKK